MARTLYIVDDKVTKALGDVITKKMIEEVKKIFTFVPKFNAALTLPDNIPQKIDFSDSIVKIVGTDAEITAVQNEAQQQQLRSIEFSIKANKVNIKTDAFMRNSANPERGGVGWHSKGVVAAGNSRAAICQTGGIASIQTATEDALKHLAPSNWTLDEAKAARDKALNKAKLSHGKDEEEKTKAALANFEKSKKHWELQDKAPKDWPKIAQETFGIALGRIVAHEARHQYVGPHFDEGGLGGESAEMLGVDKSAKFLKEDENQILAAITNFEKDQKTATVHIETFPKGQAFAFK